MPIFVSSSAETDDFIDDVSSWDLSNDGQGTQVEGHATNLLYNFGIKYHYKYLYAITSYSFGKYNYNMEINTGEFELSNWANANLSATLINKISFLTFTVGFEF